MMKCAPFFLPIQSSDGTWLPATNPEFGQLREYIDACMSPQRSELDHVLLTRSEAVIEAFIAILESLIPLPPRRTDLPERIKAIVTLKQLAAQHRQRLMGKTLQLHAVVKKQRKPKKRKRRSGNTPDAPGYEELRLRQECRTLKKEIAALEDELRNLDLKIAALKKTPSDRNRFKIQRHSVDRIRHDFELWKRGDLYLEPIAGPVKRVTWEILKPSGETWEAIIRHYERVTGKQGKKLDTGRLKLIYSLKPDEIFIGLADFEGYVVSLLSD